MEQRIGITSKMIGAIGRTVLHGEEGTDKGYMSASGQCCGNTHLDIWLQSMDSAGQTRDK